MKRQIIYMISIYIIFHHDTLNFRIFASSSRNNFFSVEPTTPVEGAWERGPANFLCLSLPAFFLINFGITKFWEDKFHWTRFVVQPFWLLFCSPRVYRVSGCSPRKQQLFISCKTWHFEAHLVGLELWWWRQMTGHVSWWYFSCKIARLAPLSGLAPLRESCNLPKDPYSPNNEKKIMFILIVLASITG